MEETASGQDERGGGKHGKPLVTIINKLVSLAKYRRFVNSYQRGICRYFVAFVDAAREKGAKPAAANHLFAPFYLPWLERRAQRLLTNPWRGNLKMQRSEKITNRFL